MDSNFLKDLIYSKKHDEACNYLIDNIEQLLCNHIPSHEKNAFISVSDVPQSLTGSLMSYQLLQESKKNLAPELAVMKLMTCYNNMKNILENK